MSPELRHLYMASDIVLDEDNKKARDEAKLRHS